MGFVSTINDTKVYQRVLNDTKMYQRVKDDTKVYQRVIDDTKVYQRVIDDTKVYQRVLCRFKKSLWTDILFYFSFINYKMRTLRKYN